jgi:hypothetical protein
MSRRLTFQKTDRLECPDAIERLLLASKQAELDKKQRAATIRRMSPQHSSRSSSNAKTKPPPPHNKLLSAGQPPQTAAPKHGRE